ncbi:MAG: helix-turn-helix transcriptional regulator [Microcystis sp. LE19-338.1B]|nr:helix-turn-helix transcriptional regulator [Microcystis sp. LE19-338.1B]
MPLHYHAVERVILAMHESLDEPLSLEDMASIALLSPYHFNRIFHQITGIPPSRFLYALRLEVAKRLLLTTQLSVTDICYEVGYNSLGSFVTRFTQLVGLSPGSLRRLAAKLDPSSLKEYCQHLTSLDRVVPLAPSLMGQIETPESFTGLIFVGLFSTSIPQSQPIRCTLLTASGSYRLTRVPDGLYYVFAAAFTGIDRTQSYLLQETFLHGYVGPVTVHQGQSNQPLDISLRAKSLTDPPILTALPFLLNQYLTKVE